MRRKLWIMLVAFTFVFSIPMGGVAAQSQPAPAVTWSSPAGLAVSRGQPGDKLSFRLAALADSAVLAAGSADTQARALSMPASGAGSFIKDPQGRLLVDVRLSQVSDANLAALKRNGQWPCLRLFCTAHRCNMN